MLLRPGTFELDSLTFDKGKLNVSEILSALNRSDLFCLFLSDRSVNSPYVDFEQKIAFELIGAGKAKNFLTICLDDTSFDKISKNARFFNAVRKIPSPEAAARIIIGNLISAKKEIETASHPFIGRDQELRELESQALDFSRRKLKCIFLSGNSGVGRKSIAENFLQRQYPHVLRSFPKIEIESYAGYDEIYREITAALTPSLSIKDFVNRAEKFSKFSDEAKAEGIAKLINRSLNENIVVFALDAGGLLQHSGQLSPEFEAVIDFLDDTPHPPLVIISPRMTPRRFRRKAGDIAYLPVGALNRDNATRLISWTMRNIDASPNQDQLENLIELSDLHPYNIYEIKDRVSEVGIDAFIADTAGFISWKHKETSDYLRSITINDNEKKILAILLFAPELDFGSLAESVMVNQADVSLGLQRLIDLHILRYDEDRFSISPPLRIAVERDPRIKLEETERGEAIRRLARALTVGFDDGTAPVALADTAVLSTLESGTQLGALSAALLLPSHRVWLARRHYDAGHWKDCIRLTQDAIKDRSRLSHQGFIAACRLLCLAAGRSGNQEAFKLGISKLNSIAKDNWSLANVSFLNGFNVRIQGKLLDAEKFFRSAYEYNSNDRSTVRELASIYLILGEDNNAEKYARIAYELAPNNPYTIDVLVSALVKTLGPKCIGNVEVEELLSRLETLDDEEHRSFSYTRKAEIELLYGNSRDADKHITEAIKRTPHLFEPKFLKAKILLKNMSIIAAGDAIRELERLTSRHSNSENKANRRQVLALKADYLVETRQFSDARKVFGDDDCFSDADREREHKKIDLAEAYNSSSRKYRT